MSTEKTQAPEGAERKAAEQAYATTAFNYPEAPIGSRDWCLYWDGWQARAALAAQPQAAPAEGGHTVTVTVELAADEVLVALKRGEDYEDVHPELVSEDAIGDRWPVYRTIHGAALFAQPQDDQPTWAGAVAFIQHAQNAAGAPGHWADEFLTWYKPDEWFGEHRAAAVFVGQKIAAIAAQPHAAESPCACWPGRMCARSAQCAESVRGAPSPAEGDAEALALAAWIEGEACGGSNWNAKAKRTAEVLRALASKAQPKGMSVAWRPEVVAFADAMEHKLRANDWKGTWKHDAPGALMERVHEELNEFWDELFTRGPRDTDEHRAALLNEAADVANMLMMVVDTSGALPVPAPAVDEVRELMSMTEAQIDDELRALGIDPATAAQKGGEAVARALQRAGGYVCGMCGKAAPHEHTPDEVVIFRNGVKRGARAQAPAPVDVDDLAQYIRQIDGRNNMGAGALAERIVEWLGRQAPAVGAHHEPTEAQLVAGLKECEPLGELIDWREGFGRDEMRATYRAMLAAAPAVQEDQS